MIPSAPASTLVDSIHASIHTVEPVAPLAFTLSRPARVVASVCPRVAPQNDASSTESKARVQMADLLDAFKACLAYDLVWIEDFKDEDVEISRDLFEVLQAFADLRRQSADEA
jgi:hypothetical protein